MFRTVPSLIAWQAASRRRDGPQIAFVGGRDGDEESYVMAVKEARP